MADRMRGIDEIIQKAIQEGAFKQLPGKGQPFNWDNPAAVDDDWQLAYHLLKENGFAPDFIETRQSIETELAETRQALTRTWAWREKALKDGDNTELVESQWVKARTTFTERVGELNKQIRDYNLIIPTQSFFRNPVDVEREIAGLIESRSSS